MASPTTDAATDTRALRDRADLTVAMVLLWAIPVLAAVAAFVLG
jgi:hypothetical protein